MKGVWNAKKSLIALLAILLAVFYVHFDALVAVDAEHQQSEPPQIGLTVPEQPSGEIAATEPTPEDPMTDYRAGLDRFDLMSVPEYQKLPYCEVNENQPFFSIDAYPSVCFEYYAPLDALGRCGVTMARIGKELMPTEERGSIGMVKPSGWHTIRYDDLVEGHYLYNICKEHCMFILHLL